MPLPSEILETLPEELQTDPSLVKFDSIQDLAKSYKEMSAFQGRSIRIPGEDAGAEARQEFINKLVNNAPELMVKPDFTNPEQADEFYATLGVPDDFSKYENPENTALDPEVEAQLREVLHTAKLTPVQYQKVVKQLSDMNAEAIENNNQLRKSDLESLSGKWGNALEQRMEAARKANEEFYPGRSFDNLSSAEIEGLYQIHESVTQPASTQAASQPKESALRLTPAEAEAQAAEIMRNPKLWDDATPQEEKQRLMARVVELKKEAGYDPELPRA